MRIDPSLVEEVYTFWRGKALAIHAATGANQTFALQYVGANLAHVGAQNGGNALDLPAGDMHCMCAQYILFPIHDSDTGLLGWTTTIDWEKEEDDALVKSVSIDTTRLFQQLGQRNGSYLPFIFMNDAAQDQNPIESYGSRSITKLNRISRIYDETQVFQRLQNNGFLLSK